MRNELFTEEIIILIIFVFGYLAYYFSYESKLVYQTALKLGDTEDRKEYTIHIPRIIGFITLGLIPALVILLFFDHPISEYGMMLPHSEFGLLISLVLLIISLLVSIFRPTKDINIDFYPQVRLLEWTKRDHFRNAAYWTLYLLGYEFMLRGPLFFTCLYAFGLVPAIVINSVIYSLIHIYKGKGEAFGAFFFGILLCLVAFYTHSFMVPFIIHVILAIGNDLKALKAGEVH